MKRKLFMLLACAAFILTGCTHAEPSGAAPDVSEQTAQALTEAHEVSVPPAQTSAASRPAPETVFEYSAWAECEEITLDQAISESNTVVRAKYAGCDTFEGYIDYCFEPLEVYKGAIDGLCDGVFYVRADIGDDENGLVFADGEYIMPLKYVNSVYFDYPVYNVIGHITLPCGSDGEIGYIMCGSAAYAAPAGLSDAMAVKSLAQNTQDTSVLMFEDYIHSSALSDIIEGSDYIVKAKVVKAPFDVNAGRGMFTCELAALYKGDVPQTFQCLFFTDSVEVGGEYYFFLTRLPSSKPYKISSKNSIYSADDAAVTKALEDSGLI